MSSSPSSFRRDKVEKQNKIRIGIAYATWGFTMTPVRNENLEVKISALL